MFRKRSLQKRILIKAVAWALTGAALLKWPSVTAYALEAWADDCYVVADGACLMDADTGTVLFGQNEDTAYYPASITKVLTALLVLENCDSLTEQVTFSYDAVHLSEDNATIIGASEGDKLSVLDCLYCLLFQSANEVANALAEHVGAKHPELKETGMSDRDVFVLMMNERAEELGCTGSHFNNPSGLTDEDHYTTAHDMCLIMAAAVHNEEFLDIESHTYWTHAPIRRYPDADDPWNTVYPKHSMLKKNNSLYYQGAIAGKTGYTTSAGNTLLTAASRGGMTLVVCVLNGHSTHYSDTARLLDFGFDNFISLRVSDYEDINTAIREDFSLNEVTLIDAYVMGQDSDARVTIPAEGNFAELKKEFIAGDGSLMASSEGLVVYSYGTRTVGNARVRLMHIGDASMVKSEVETDPLIKSLVSLAAGEEPDTESEDGGPEESTGAIVPDPAETESHGTGLVRLIAVLCGILILFLGGLWLRARRARRRIKERARKRALARRKALRDNEDE